MNAEIKVFDDKPSLADAVINDLKNNLSDLTQDHSLALSGGSTPRTIYQQWSTIKDGRLWSNVHFFWADERCVPPDDEDSNYKMAYESFLSKVNISENQIHRIYGEADPEMEVKRYEEEIKDFLPTMANGLPQFDWILLGVGTDGHTASLFPNSDALKEKHSFCVVAQHPQTGQKRISLTLPVINNAKKVTFLVTGEEKAEIVRVIIKNGQKFPGYPAAQVSPQDGILQWYMDKAAARLL